ncbi:hypothetical protein GCM10011613_29070 [Cellvibrio zantedeschiae]|uniref:Sulfotransferase domain-containing protein n=1 Tax=Cellvibrio zantedeschiae TaxID=1237077 RepID=A0ABQ3BB34_9GAMM|nr:sulfotransferase domain-containing protein [Cellvibrio zantedeschiae]GGY82466.1 hypothetical protein GCM10011613_29070 [Cellvibrio zantedeschiae]
MKSLDFMIIGAQKSGTSALSHFLAQHTDVCMAAGKEVHLFDAPDYSQDWTVEEINQRYSNYFEGANESLVWGEATPIYLYRPEIIPALKRYNPALKLIIILRDPAERAISHYEMEKSRTNETLPLWLALLRESGRLLAEGKNLGHAHRCHSYVDRGFYAEQLNCVRQYFSDAQILVLESEELKHKHAEAMAKVCKFLAIDPTHGIKSEQVFSGNYQKKHLSPYYSLVKTFLKWRFHAANMKLKMVLLEMGVAADWRWLK